MYKRGQIILFSEEVYSDYGILGLFKVRRQFDMKAEEQEYLAQREPKNYDYHLRTDFIAYLAKKGYIEDVEHTEVWLGAYEKLEIN